MSHPDGRLEVLSDGAMLLLDAKGVRIAHGRVAKDKLHYESGLHFV